MEMGWRDETDVDVNLWMRWGYNIYTHNMWYIIFKCPHRILIEMRVDTFTHTQFNTHIYIYILYVIHVCIYTTASEMDGMDGCE